MIGRGNPKGKDGMRAVRLGLEGIGVEGGHVILDIEGVEPIEVAMHETGAKTDGVPFAEVVIDTGRGRIETLFIAIKFAVVVEVVHADFESVFDQAIE